MKTSRIVINWFVDFDKEEKWINEMSGKGWAFWHTNGVIYKFKSCEPATYIYQIDFDEQKSKNGVGDYVTLFEPTASQYVAAGKGHIVASVGEKSGEIPYTSFIALDSYLNKNGEKVEKFVIIQIHFR